MLTFAAVDDVVCGLVDNYYKREIKYEGFGGGGRPRAHPLAPLNLALNWLLYVKAIASQSWDILGHSVPES